MLTSVDTTDIAHVVQLAVAPVFLLTGVGAILSVLTTRMGRVIDHAHRIDGWIEHGKDPANYAQELISLKRRLSIIHKAITFCSLAAFLVCGVVITIFVGTYLDARIGGAVAFLFAAAMLMLMSALCLFLAEARIAQNSIIIGPKG